jgi:hypothetical protein
VNAISRRWLPLFLTVSDRAQRPAFMNRFTLVELVTMRFPL